MRRRLEPVSAIVLALFVALLFACGGDGSSRGGVDKRQIAADKFFKQSVRTVTWEEHLWVFNCRRAEMLHHPGCWCHEVDGEER